MSHDTLPDNRHISGRWVLQELVGKGGMGTVFRALELGSGETVAVKLLHDGEESHIERFSREASVLAELQHPSIVQYRAHGVTHDGRAYIVMEWLDGEDLGHRLRRGALTVGQIVDLVAQVAEALEFAHSKGVVHRDIKPGNIFLHRHTTAKLLDFGIARKLSGTHLTRTGMVVGTVEYMAPEQVRSSRDSGPSADIYALGCVLYECITGDPPFSGSHVAAILARILFEEPHPLGLINPKLPSALAALVDGMLQKDETKRPLKVAETLRHIRPLIDSQLQPTGSGSVAQSSKTVMTMGEIRMITAVLASPDPSFTTDYDARTSVRSQIEMNVTQDLAIPESVKKYPGVRISLLPDGWLLAVFDPVGQIGLLEQVVNAANLAQDILHRRPMTQIALAVTPQGATQIKMVGPLVEACTRILDQVGGAAEAGATRTDGVWLDELSAQVLSQRFHVEKKPMGTKLGATRGERESESLFLGKPIAFVGRETELGTLDLWIRSTLEEQSPRTLIVISPPGIGKSRLLHEYLLRLKTSGMAYLRMLGRCESLTEQAPLAPLEHALRLHFGVQNGQDLEAQRQLLRNAVIPKLSQEMGTHVIGFLGEFIGVPFSVSECPPLAAARHDPKVMSEQLTQALIDYFRMECEAQPVVLVLEDLHFCDQSTIRMVETLHRELSGCPFVVVAAARPEVNDKFPLLWNGIQKDVLQIRPLSKKHMEKLAQQFVGSSVSPTVLERVVQLADGNPLFLEELLRSVSSGHQDTLPLTILAVQQQRVQALPTDARRILRAASIFGLHCWKGGLSELTGLAEPDVEDCLRYLVRTEILDQRRQSRFAREAEYVFRHALMREAVYQMVTEEDLKIGHELAAQYLLRIDEKDAFVLASHFERAGNLEAAGAQHVRAAADCLARFELDGANRGAVRAIELGVSGETHGMACSIIAQARYWGVDWAPVPDWAGRALELCRPGSQEYCRALSVFMMASVMTGRQEFIGPLVQKYLATEPSTDAIDAYFEAGNFMVLMFVMLAERPLVETFLARLEAVVASASHLAIARAMLSFCHGAYLRLLSSQPWTAASLLRDAHTRFQYAGDLRHETLSACLLALAEREVGNVEKGAITLQTAMRQAERLSGTLLPTVQLHQAMLLEHSQEQAGRQRAYDCARRVVVGFKDNAVYVALAQGIVAQGLLYEGAITEAAAMAETAWQGLQATPTMQAIVAPARVEALLAAGRLGDAEQAARALTALYDKLADAGYLEPIGRTAAAAALLAAGFEEEAATQRELAKAKVWQRAKAAPTEEARQLFLSAVPENVRALAADSVVQSQRPI